MNQTRPLNLVETVFGPTRGRVTALRCFISVNSTRQHIPHYEADRTNAAEREALMDGRQSCLPAVRIVTTLIAIPPALTCLYTERDPERRFHHTNPQLSLKNISAKNKSKMMCA